MNHPTEHTARTQSPRTGPFATLRAFLPGANVTGAPSISRCDGTDAPCARSPFAFLAVGLAALGTLLLNCSPALAAFPDGRVYEQVSPVNKNGNVVRENTERHTLAFGLGAQNGNAVAFLGSGAMGTASNGLTEVFVSRRSGSGWATSSTRPLPPGEVNIFGSRPLTLVPSSGFSSFLFTTLGAYVSAEPLGGALGNSSSNIFLSGDPAVEPAWVAQPTIADPIPAPGHNTAIRNYLAVGGTPDFGTVYFTYSGTLIPQDASRAPNVGTGTLEAGDVTPSKEQDDPWGFYEWTGGTLGAAGVLPNGTLDPFGAAPAATAGQSNSNRHAGNPFDLPETLNNEISTDGSRAFFVSPDPVASTVTDAGACAEEPSCTSAPPQLYVRETAPDGAKSTVLVSQSQLPGHQGEPAPDGPIRVEGAALSTSGGTTTGGSYVYASPDGSQAFFASADQLTSAAPADSAVKEYDFNLQTEELAYLPGVVGPILASAPDGSDLIFKNTATTPSQLDLWVAGPGGGAVTPIAQLPVPPAHPHDAFAHKVDVDGGRASTDGSVFVFRTNSPISGFNDGGGFAQVFRYSVDTSKLLCVSCLPEGVAPSAQEGVTREQGAQVSHNNEESGEPLTTLDTRVLSSDGSRVFFDTPEPLLPQDINGKRDVYEWEAPGAGSCTDAEQNGGCLSLISSGHSPQNSFLLDSSASGGDVFFATTSGLASGDTDESLDVYDARIPRPGDNPPPPPAPCQGDACQRPPTQLTPPAAPASATYGGGGNLTPRHRRHKHRHRGRHKRSHAAMRTGNDRRIG